MNHSLFVEIESFHYNCKGEDICGDCFMMEKQPSFNRIIAVLSDGLGHGVKAGILSNMTASMAMKFIASNQAIVPSAEIMMDALPVCQQRKVSYATFTIVDHQPGDCTRVIEMDNPPLLLIRNGKVVELEYEMVWSPRHENRKMRLYELDMQPQDRLVLMSDGVTQAGLGSENYKLGWRRQGCAAYVLERIGKEPYISARQLARDIVDEALQLEENHDPGDDMTAAVFYFRVPRRTILLTGPPFAKEYDQEYAYLLSAFRGSKVICGGTSAEIVARELQREITTDLSTCARGIPPISDMEGVDLITEGIMTLTRVAQLLEAGRAPTEQDGASRLTNLLRDSDSIQFVVGTKINEAHQDPRHPEDLEIRRNIIKRLAQILEKKYLKEVAIRYI
jgi:hypothetical protein